MRKSNQTTRNTLRWINKIRREHGCTPLDDILPGLKGDGENCPIAASLRDCEHLSHTRVGIARAWLSSSSAYVEATPVDMPKMPQVFIAEFDNGNFPEYDRYVHPDD